MIMWNLALMVMWAAVNGEFTVSSLATGFAVGALVLLFTRRTLGVSLYFRKIYVAASLLGYFFFDLFRSSLKVAAAALTPTDLMRPGIIALPLDAETPTEITMVSNLISLTPGTLSLELAKDQRTLFVHVMFLDQDVEKIRRELKDGIERRVLELLR